MLESLSQEQWDAETLCAGWDAGDLVAHMLVREREPAALGIVVKPLAFLHDMRLQARKKRHPRGELLKDLRNGPPPWWKVGRLGRSQVGEDWIHGQDVVRGGASQLPGATLTPSDGSEDPDVEPLLWKDISHFAPLTLRGVDVDGIVRLTDGEKDRTFKVGGFLASPAHGAQPDLTITGPVGELLLFATGRPAPQLEFEGDDTLRAAVTGAKRGV